MSEWKIVRIGMDDMQRPVVSDVVAVDSLEYHGEWMADEYVTVTVKSPTPIDFHIDDFISYRGDIYALNYDPNVVKKARRGTYGEGFTYDNIRFVSIAGKLKGYGFKDFVIDDNHLAYSSLDKFSFYAESVEDLADRIQANLDRQDSFEQTLLVQMYGNFKVLTPNWLRCQQRGILQEEWEAFYNDSSTYGTWGSGTGVTLGETDVDIQVDGIWCMDAMKLSYTKFGLTWYSKQMNGVCYFVIGGPAVVADKGDQMIFRYGKNLGLYEIERTSPDDQELVTRMFAYGSEQNLPLNYYANIGRMFYGNVTECTIEDLDGSEPYGYATLDVGYVRGMFNGAEREDRNGTEVTVTLDGTTITALSLYPTGSVTTVKLACFLHTEGTTIGQETDINKLMAFLTALSVGDMIYFTAGINKNKWPQTHITYPSGYNYPGLLSINKLMLPGFPMQSLKAWVTIHHPELLSKYDFSDEQYDPWVMSKNTQYAGVIEGTANFDGSSQKEIYPTIEGTGYNVVGWGSQSNPGAVSDNVIAITDNGYVDEGGNFTICMNKAGGLDWKALYDTKGDNDMVLSMTSGYCVCQEFKVVKVEEGSYEYIRTTYPCWVLICERKQDDLGRFLPCDYQSGTGMFHVLNGDTFTVTGIEIPAEYIAAASERLLIAACGWLDRRDHVRYTYLPKVDHIYMARQNEAVQDERDAATYGTVSLHDTLRAGIRLEFEDAADLGIERYGAAAPFIDVLTIREDGENGVPTYDVVLRDEKERGTLEKLTERIEELTGATQIVERTSRVLEYIEYQEWSPTGKYYHEAMNVDEDRLEQSYVYHRGKKWMCMRTLTTEEPQLGAQDWVVVGGDQTFQIKFYDAATGGYAYGESVIVRVGYVNVPVYPIVLWGTDDVSTKVNAWLWERETKIGGKVNWSTSRNITITDASLPPAWSPTNPAIFTCTATINGIDIPITNIVTI